jgi:hypothetical protein
MQSNAKTDEGLWNKSDVCQRWKVSLRTLDYGMAKGWVPFIKLQGAVRFVPDDIRNLEKSRRVGSAHKFATRKGGAR